MKVSTLFKTLVDIDYVIQSQTGYTLEEGFISSDDHRLKLYDSKYWTSNITSIKTVQNNDILFITIEN